VFSRNRHSHLRTGREQGRTGVMDNRRKPRVDCRRWPPGESRSAPGVAGNLNWHAQGLDDLAARAARAGCLQAAVERARVAQFDATKLELPAHDSPCSEAQSSRLCVRGGRPRRCLGGCVIGQRCFTKSLAPPAGELVSHLRVTMNGHGRRHPVHPSVEP
jgi:hypothetical protein